MNKLPPIPEKKYFSISEVACLCELKAHTLRFWEKEFDQLNPKVKPSGIRKFTKDDIENISTIYSLLKEEGLTIQGAKKRLKSKNKINSNNLSIIKKLEKIKFELKNMKSNI